MEWLLGSHWLWAVIIIGCNLNANKSNPESTVIFHNSLTHDTTYHTNQHHNQKMVALLLIAVRTSNLISTIALKNPVLNNLETTLKWQLWTVFKTISIGIMNEWIVKIVLLQYLFTPNVSYAYQIQWKCCRMSGFQTCIWLAFS